METQIPLEAEGRNGKLLEQQENQRIARHPAPENHFSDAFGLVGLQFAPDQPSEDNDEPQDPEEIGHLECGVKPGAGQKQNPRARTLAGQGEDEVHQGKKQGVGKGIESHREIENSLGCI